MKWKTNSQRIWLFRFLVLIASVLMLISFIKPWWIGRFDATHTIRIYGWGLRDNMVSLASYLARDVTPLWKIMLAWIYVGISITLALFSTWLKRWWGSLLLGITGLGLISYAAVAINIVVKSRLMDFGIQLQGFASVQHVVSVYATLQKGYYLAYVAGGIMVILSLLRGFIMGKQQ
jgi:hypothetical protein